MKYKIAISPDDTVTVIKEPPELRIRSVGAVETQIIPQEEAEKLLKQVREPHKKLKFDRALNHVVVADTELAPGLDSEPGLGKGERPVK